MNVCHTYYIWSFISVIILWTIFLCHMTRHTQTWMFNMLIFQYTHEMRKNLIGQMLTACVQMWAHFPQLPSFSSIATLIVKDVKSVLFLMLVYCKNSCSSHICAIYIIKFLQISSETFILNINVDSNSIIFIRYKSIWIYYYNIYWFNQKQM